MSTSQKVVTGIKYTVFISAVIICAIFLYDLMLAAPQPLKGVIVDKVYVAKQNISATSIMPNMRYKQKDYLVSALQHDQWLALVETEDGRIFKVNCHEDHYNDKQVGDTLHFKEYAGDIMGIDYFAHGEEDEDEKTKGI